MDKTTSKFLSLYENVYQRFQNSGVLIGDVIKFKSDFKSSHEYKSLNPGVQKKIDELMKTDQHIRVVSTKPKIPGSNASQPTVGYADVAIDTGGGRYTEFITIPIDIVEVQDFYPNLPPIPDSFTHKSKVNIKPEPVEDFKGHPTRQTDRGTGRYMSTDTSLPTTNTSIPTNVNSTMATPEVSPSYTGQYMADL
jgi:hypothetical protein